ncbi:MAG TPA: hypothetical protein VHV54_04735, partial [Candidatus Binatia bacterium]|nr:hypothetical protein [Candidatus Binatia bacterium]
KSAPFELRLSWDEDGVETDGPATEAAGVTGRGVAAGAGEAGATAWPTLAPHLLQKFAPSVICVPQWLQNMTQYLHTFRG